VGVRRISIGSGLAMVAWAAFARAARDMALNGRFETLADALTFSELNQLFSSPSRSTNPADQS